MEKLIKLFIEKKVNRSEFLILYYNETAGHVSQEIARKDLNIGVTQYYDAIKSLKKRGLWNMPYDLPNEQITYLIYDKFLYKIGRTTDLDKRVAALKTANPRVEVIDWVVEDHEKDLHDKYSKNRREGEWFEFSAEEIKEVLKTFNFLKEKHKKRLVKLVAKDPF